MTFTNILLRSWKTTDTLKCGSSAEQRLKTLLRNTERSVVLHFTYFSWNFDYHFLSQVKDHNNISGNGNNREDYWEYFDEMDAILGTRLTSSSVALVHSGGDDVSQAPRSALNSNGG